MVAEVRAELGDEAAEQFLAYQENIQRLTGGGRASSRTAWRGSAADLDRNGEGELQIHPVNFPAVLVWLACGHLWDRCPISGRWLAHRSDVALTFAKELQAEDPSVHPLVTTANVSVIAAEVMRLQHELVARQEARR